MNYNDIRRYEIQLDEIWQRISGDYYYGGIITTTWREVRKCKDFELVDTGEDIVKKAIAALVHSFKENPEEWESSLQTFHKINTGIWRFRIKVPGSG